MFELKIIRNSEILKQDIDEIIRIKSFAWPYPYLDQIKWLIDNLKDNDLHLILYNEDESVAYLNLIIEELLIDGFVYNIYGVGNVCAIAKGNGYGTILLKSTNQFIISKNKIGLLFCKPQLVAFYKKCGWILVEKKQMSLSIDNSNIETMILNSNLPFNSLEFKGKVF